MDDVENSQKLVVYAVINYPPGPLNLTVLFLKEKGFRDDIDVGNQKLLYLSK